jgi:Iap family predicted aminopeptidase
MNSPVLSSRGILDEAIDTAFMREVVEHLASTGSSSLGFRMAGTPEEVALSNWIGDRMSALGLVDVTLEPVPVDAWRFRGARVQSLVGAFECASFGGSPPTPPGGLEAEVVFVGRGTADDLAAADLDSRIALIDWRGGDLLWPSMVAAGAAREGAIAALVTSLPGGAFYQRDGALGAFDAYGLPDPIPIVTLRKEDAQALIAAGNPTARVTLDVEVERGATAYNVVGTLPGRRNAAPIVVAGHHDAWFYGALDDASGVASTLALAKAMRDTGYVPDGPIVFCSHTAEEFGLLDAPFDYCIGAGWQIQHEHPEWADSAALYLNIEGTGMAQPLLIEAPPELAAFEAEVCAAATEDGLLRQGVVRGAPRPWTEAWPFLAAGVPAVNVNSHHLDFFRTEYHTQYDDPGFLDYGNLRDLTCVYGRLLVAADARGRELLEPAARARAVRSHGRLDDAARAGADVEPLRAALDSYERAAERPAAAAARAAFAHLARELEAIDAAEGPVLRHEQALRDVEAIDACAVERVGRNALARDLAEDLVVLDAARHAPGYPRLAWAELGHLTASPVLCGDSVDLERARRDTAEELDRRLQDTTDAFERAARMLETSMAPREAP